MQKGQKNRDAGLRSPASPASIAPKGAVRLQKTFWKDRVAQVEDKRPAVFTMSKKRAPYSPDFRRQMVELVRSGQTPVGLAKEFEPDDCLERRC